VSRPPLAVVGQSTHPELLLAQRIRARVVEQLENSATTILKGNIKTIEDYREAIGKHKALRGVLALVDEATEAWRKGDDDEL
jgi:hypothetical protein